MSACERCWGAAYTLSRALGGHQVDHYRRLLEERDGTACPAPTTHRPGSGTPSAAGSDDERQGFVVTPEESPDE